MEDETVESRRRRKEEERERRRLRDRERRQSMTQDERERHLARRRKNYKLRRQRAEIGRIDIQIPTISTLSSPPDSGSSSVPMIESDQRIEVNGVAKLKGTIRLNRVKHLARTLAKSSTNGAESSNKGDTDTKTRCAMSSGPCLSRIKQLIRSKGGQEGLKLEQSLQI